MPNRRRGEVALLLGGRAYTLRLTLNALAELEDAFGAESLTALGARFARGGLSSHDLAALLGAALRGGGHALTDREAGDLALDGGIEAVADALAEALRLALAPGEAPNPSRPGASRSATSSAS